MKAKEIREKTESELMGMLFDYRQQAQDLAVKLRLNQDKQTHKLKILKKDIARILTILKQKKDIGNH